MRYIDTGSRDPNEALGVWLRKVLDGTVVALRWQTGFFSAKALGLFVSTFEDLHKANLLLRVLVGSNDGTTPRADVENLLRLSGPARSNRQIGIVSFDSGYFHPKTIHIGRRDGSTAAYVGSANLTESGIASLHVEAGVLLDTRDRDDPAVIARIADAVDWWFTAPRDGLNSVNASADLDPLVADGVLDVPCPPTPSRPPPKTTKGRKRRGFSLKPLVKLPGLPGVPPKRASGPVSGPMAAIPVAPAAKPAKWGKHLTNSDAQRKRTGNQRGSITLVQAGHAINAQIYFRKDFFVAASWKTETTHTGRTREVAHVPFNVKFLGRNLGLQQIMITHASNRESGQANYTSLLHLNSTLAPLFSKVDVSKKWIQLDRLADGSYSLEIRDAA
jgi:hypothetical protein